MRAAHIGLTGSIGAGKSTVAKWFENQGVPVYYADSAAKRLMVEDAHLMDQIEAEFGPGIYVDGELQRGVLASKAFVDADSTQRINALVHPAVHDDFVVWRSEQDVPFVIREAAILFESGTASACDAIILVEAPIDTRLQRVIDRSGWSESSVRDRMAQQWPDGQKRAQLSPEDYIIDNGGEEAQLWPQVEHLYQLLLARFQ